MAAIERRVAKDGTVSYRAKVRLRGAMPETATFERKTDAVKWAGQIEANIRQRKHFPLSEAKRHTFAEMIDRYIRDVLPKKGPDGRNRERQLLWWKSKLGPMRLSDITVPQLAECRDFLQSEPRPATAKQKEPRYRSPATVTRYLAALSHVFRVAVREWHWLEDNPLQKVDKPAAGQGRTRYLSDSERERLLDACRKSECPELLDLVVLALSTGARRGELLNLRWSQVDLPRRIAILKKTKNGHVRALPLSGLALELMQARSKVRQINSDLVFAGRTDPTKPLHFRSAWLTAVKRAGISDFKFHDLRHSCASYLAMNGATLAEIAEVLGHRTLSMVKRYAHLSQGHVASVVERMNSKVFG